jgi:hypothetical protein
MLVKLWAKRRGLVDSSRGGFSSYALVLLVVHFLQATTYHGATYHGITCYGTTYYGATYHGATYYGATYYGATYGPLPIGAC